ncbi:hypothetical protein QR685DRAFT_574188 [Neurospora intermedia]|uniref:Uncharacterized protein n=1 Tax=Neurospora intermedia TaxID=5142 RepID=A0ABR3D5V4_NEUIN
MFVARWFVGESEKVDPVPNFCKGRERWGRVQGYVTGEIIVGGVVHHSRHRRWTQAGKTRNVDAETLGTGEKNSSK